MSSERTIQQEILLDLGSRPGVRLFRNNVGVGWQGRMVERRGNLLTLADPRPLHAGLIKGSGDLIGWQAVTITPEMVGRKIAVFTSVETKATKGRATQEQRVWLEQLQLAGGAAGIVRSVEEARSLLL